MLVYFFFNHAVVFGECRTNRKNRRGKTSFCRHENIKAAEGLSFIGLQPFDARGYDITSYRVRTAEIFNGSLDWRYFERVIEMDELKMNIAKAKPLPGNSLSFRIGMYNQPGTLWVDGLEVIPLEKK